MKPKREKSYRAEVASDHEGSKLYNYCRATFPTYSKKELRTLFHRGCIYYNGIKSSGIQDECKRIKVGDIIEIVPLQPVTGSGTTCDIEDSCSDVNVIHMNDIFSIIHKQSGISCAMDRPYDTQVKSKLSQKSKKKIEVYVDNDTNASINEDTGVHVSNSESLYNDDDNDKPSQIYVNYEFLYRPEKSLSSLLLIPSTDSYHSIFYTMWLNKQLLLYYECIICGKLQTDTNNITLNVPYNQYMYTLNITILSIVRCRSQEYLSHIRYAIIPPTPLPLLSDSIDNNNMNNSNDDIHIHDGDGDGNKLNMGDDDNIYKKSRIDKETTCMITDVYVGVEDGHKYNDNDNTYIHVDMNGKDGDDDDGDDVSEDEDDGDEFTDIIHINTNTSLLSDSSQKAESSSNNPILSPNIIQQSMLYLSRIIKSLRRVLSKAGYPIVGDQKLVKKSKGIYAAITSIEIQSLPDDLINSRNLSSNIINSPSNASSLSSSISATYIDSMQMPYIHKIETPYKFIKLLQREDYFWNKAHETTTSDNYNHGDTSMLSTSTFEQRSGNHDDSNITQQPIEYQQGYTTFCHLKFLVNPAVMIPRVSSEVLVYEAVRLLHEFETDQLKETRNVSVDVDNVPLKVLDLGTGSGNLILSILYHYQASLSANTITNTNTDNVTASSITQSVNIQKYIYGVAIDISKDALAVATSNAKELQLSDICTFQIGSFDELLTCIQIPIPSRQQPDTYVSSENHDEKIINHDTTPLSSSSSTALNTAHNVFTSTSSTTTYTSLLFKNNDITEMITNTDINITSTAPITRDTPSMNSITATDTDTGTRYHLIICNPPYSNIKERHRLSKQVRSTEPTEATYTPENQDAYYYYRIIAKKIQEGYIYTNHYHLYNYSTSVHQSHSHSHIDSDELSTYIHADDVINNHSSSTLPLNEVYSVPRLHHVLLYPNAYVIFEIGQGQDKKVKEIMSKMASCLIFRHVIYDYKKMIRGLVYQYII